MSSESASFSNGILGDCLKKNGTIFGSVAAAGGFIADVLQPLAPFAEYLFYVFGVLLGLLLLGCFALKNTRQSIISFLVFSLIATVTTGTIFGVQGTSDNNNGILAEVVPGIEKLQASLGVIEKDIADIKKDTNEIKQDTADIKQTTEEIANKIDELGSQVGKQGGIIADPNTPEEWYNNARVYELRGDYGNARRSYASYFIFNGNYLDPHLRYQSFLKVQEGRAGTREIYNEMFADSNNPVIEYAKILLKGNDAKRANIGAYLNKHSDFAPGYLDLSRLYSEAVLGEQTLDDIKNERENLKKFIELNEQGKFIKYFIDKGEASRILENANSRLASMKSLGDDTFTNPITVDAMKSNSGWSLTIFVAEKAQEIFYRLDGQSDFTSLGMLEYNDPITKQPMANPQLSVPGLNKDQRIEIKYRDSRGNLKGPYGYLFDPADAVRKKAAGILKRMPNSWISFRQFNGLNAQFTQLMSWRCGLKSIKYAIDNSIPDTEFVVPKCNPDNPYALPAGTVTTVKLSSNAKMISVQVVFSTGEESQVYSYKVPSAMQAKI